MSVAIDETHDPKLTSWVECANGHPDFPIQNLPYGIFSPQGSKPRPGVAIGERVFDLAVAAQTGLLPGLPVEDLCQDTLNAMMAWPAERRLRLRHRLSTLLSKSAFRSDVAPLLHDQASVTLHVPGKIGDYTDFYVGIHHAQNVGKLFRPDNPLLPNYKYVPIGYHGRASSVRASGEAVVRPQGQRKAPDADAPIFAPTARLDYELELGVWVGRGNALGEPIAIGQAQDHIAGLCLLNDWSARDFQAWEYQPLGPFLAKNFHTTISPWVVTTEALAPYRIAQPPRAPQDPRPLDYLWDEADQHQGALAIDLEVRLRTASMRREGLEPHLLSRGPASNMYWTIAQILTHHASNGCNLQPGDLLGTGTISAPDREGFGSLLELTDGGAREITLPNGETRRFLEDGDEILIAGRAKAEGRVPIGFGTCGGIIKPARGAAA